MKLPFFAVLFFAAALALAGCKRDEVKVYQIQNAQSPAPQNQSQPAVAIQNENALPQLQFVLPENWEQIAPSQMRVASFTITNANGESADVGVIPLPAGEDELAIVNMWRDQMQLPAVTNATAAETVSVGNDSAKLFDIASEQPLIGGKFRARILVAELTRGATSWFFKMTGEDSFVASQKPAFIQFLKSVNFADAPTIQTASATAVENIQNDPPQNQKPIWSVPPDWQEVPPSEFLVAEFSIVRADGAKAEVNVGALDGNGGGLLANVNRWRGQLGLAPVDETGLAQMTFSFPTAGGVAQSVDMANMNPKTAAKTRLVGVVLPRNGQTWFYKLMGDEPVVAQQKDAFLKFIQSANYSNVR